MKYSGSTFPVAVTDAIVQFAQAYGQFPSEQALEPGGRFRPLRGRKALAGRHRQQRAEPIRFYGLQKEFLDCGPRRAQLLRRGALRTEYEHPWVRTASRPRIPEAPDQVETRLTGQIQIHANQLGPIVQRDPERIVGRTGLLDTGGHGP